MSVNPQITHPDISRLLQSASVRSRTVLLLRPTRGLASLNLQDVWRYRDLLLMLAMRDVRLRYRQTVLGAVWVALQPLLGAAIFAFVFGRMARFSSEGVEPYFLFAYAGQLGWNAFSATLTKASASLVGNTQLVSKVFFPRLALPLSTVLSSLLDFGVSLAVLLALMLIYRAPFAPGPLILLPVWLALILLLALGLGLIGAALTVSYRDLQYVLPVLISFLTFASPVGYGLGSVAPRYREVLTLNPISSLLEGMRWSLFGRGRIDAAGVAYSVGVTLAVSMIGIVVFRSMERRFADVI